MFEYIWISFTVYTNLFTKVFVFEQTKICRLSLRGQLMTEQNKSHWSIDI